MAPVTAFVKCGGYGRGEVGAAFDALLAHLGGLERFVKPGMRVLVKPNLLRDAKPEEAVTTHPEILRACLVRLQKIGADVRVGDSPAFVASLAHVWRVSGLQAVCEELGVPLVSLEHEGCAVREGHGVSFSLCNDALEADLIVSLPKVKTHGLTLLTAGAKNLYGLVPGHFKTHLHKVCPTPQRFGQLIRDIVEALPPVLTIADGVVGMEGDGPSSGTPVELNFLAGGTDPHALDFHLCSVLGLPQREVPTLAGIAKPPAALGDEIRVAPLKRPKASQLSLLGRLPAWLTQWVGKLIWFRPRFAEKCVRCGQCARACPMQAISLDGNETNLNGRNNAGRARPPGAPHMTGPAHDVRRDFGDEEHRNADAAVGGAPGGHALPCLDASRCIGCCCCSEVCPVKAVVIVPSPLVRLSEGTFFKVDHDKP